MIELQEIQNQLETLTIEKERNETTNMKRMDELENENSNLRCRLEDATMKISKQVEEDKKQEKFELDQAQVIIHLREELCALRRVITINSQQQREQNKMDLYGGEEESSNQYQQRQQQQQQEETKNTDVAANDLHHHDDESTARRHYWTLLLAKACICSRGN